MATPTAYQIKVLQMVEKRDWPTGEPRIEWLVKRSAAIVLREGWVEEVPGTAGRFIGNIIVLTEAGRAALATAQ